jgi:hypothetical protein
MVFKECIENPLYTREILFVPQKIHQRVHYGDRFVQELLNLPTMSARVSAYQVDGGFIGVEVGCSSDQVYVLS